MRPRNRFVFVAGLHRTGTSLVSRMLAAHPEISAITGAPVPENEGCYLQGAIPHTALHGRPGHYAVDPAQHHTEASRYNTLEARRRLFEDWSPWFDGAKPWWLEKSPVNLTRMRLYQQLFPTSQFVIVLRHPQFMAAALAKWVDADAASLLAYALDAYDVMVADLAYLHAAFVMRYEDLIADPQAIQRSLCAFLSIDERYANLTLRNGNSDYRVSADVDRNQATRMLHWGYLPGGEYSDWQPSISHPLRAVRDAAASAYISVGGQKN